MGRALQHRKRVDLDSLGTGWHPKAKGDPPGLGKATVQEPMWSGTGGTRADRTRARSTPDVGGHSHAGRPHARQGAPARRVCV